MTNLGVFVPGTPAFLTENINPHHGLTNGTPVTLHSLILDPEEDVRRHRPAHRLKGKRRETEIQSFLHLS